VSLRMRQFYDPGVPVFILLTLSMFITHTVLIGVARGCSGCTCTPQGGEKFFSGLIRLIYRKMCKCTP